jgi:hypothetical protein
MELYFDFAPDVVGSSRDVFCVGVHRAFAPTMALEEIQTWCGNNRAVEFVLHARWLSVRLVSNVTSAQDVGSAEARALLNQSLADAGFYLTRASGVDDVVFWDKNLLLVIGVGLGVLLFCMLVWYLKVYCKCSCLKKKITP